MKRTIKAVKARAPATSLREIAPCAREAVGILRRRAGCGASIGAQPCGLCARRGAAVGAGPITEKTRSARSIGTALSQEIAKLLFSGN